MDLGEIDKQFNQLSDITDRVAMMNSDYDTDLKSAFQEMETLVKEVMALELNQMDAECRQVYLSHMSFHREIVAEIIVSARKLLMNDRREYLKRLVKYHRSFSSWFNRTEKNYAA